VKGAEGRGYESVTETIIIADLSFSGLRLVSIGLRGSCKLSSKRN